jgi:multidrug efflux pump subunit AcrA (membrane-fusion protein)
LSDETNAIAAELVGLAPIADPQMQGRGFLFLVSPNTLPLVPGASVTGFLSLPGQPRSGVLLPRNAVVRFNGATWVYLQTSEETFQRNEVTLEVPLENGWFVSTGLKPQDKVVVVGGQQLLSEELKGQLGD